MGLFDLFASEETRIKKNIRVVTDRDAQPEDREASAHWLVQNGKPTALLGLLSRFDMQLENQMKDAAEKDYVQSLCASVGEPLREPLNAWLRRCRVFARPLTLIEDLFGKGAAIDAAMDMLEVEYKRDDLNKPQKKREVLIWLADIRDARLIDFVLRFLEDFDEGVRYAAAEVIIAQEDDRGRELLLNRLAHPEEDSNRLRTRLAEVFIARRWSLGERAQDVADRPPSGYTVADGRLTRA